MDESNEAMDLAWRLVEETGANVFLTGKAGTGKTTFLKRLKAESNKTIAVLAPTGIAALNAGGTTIHSFFQLSFSPYIPGIGQADAGTSRYDRYSKEKLKVLRSIDTIVIDEISMVRADVLDAIDAKLRKYRNPSLAMGGVQLVMIGDLQQLPPVVKEDEWSLLSQHYNSPYFFDSDVLRQSPYETIELTKVYRQQDSDFLDMLNAIRDNKADRNVLDSLNTRYIPGFNPREEERYIRLMTHNYQQQEFNERKMKELPGKPHIFTARTEGDFPESMYPADASLTLKVGAQVMFIKNDSSGSRRYYNGLIGIVKSITPDGKVAVANGDTTIMVEEEIWENITYSIDKKDNRMKEKISGTFRQIPLRAAWAITIHKSQGLTFDKAIINASAAFAHGQTYVALSRCRTLEGLVLEQPLPPHAIICDNKVADFISHRRSDQADAKRVSDLQSGFRLRVLLELVDLTSTYEAMKGLHRAVEEAHSKTFPKMTAQLSEILNKKCRALLDVSYKFQNQLRSMSAAGAGADRIQQRICAGCRYFLDELRPMWRFMEEIPQTIDNKELKKRFDEALEKMEYEAKLKEKLMEESLSEGITPTPFMKIKRDCVNSPATWLKKTAKPKTSADILNPGLYELLTDWRREKAAADGVPAFCILGNKTLVAIANEMPTDYESLLEVPGIGKKKRAEIGLEILEIIDGWLDRDKE